MSKEFPTGWKGPKYFMGGRIIKIGGLAKILGCCPATARKIAMEAEGFPPKKIWARGLEGWSRAEVLAYLKNPTALEVPQDESRR